VGPIFYDDVMAIIKLRGGAAWGPPADLSGETDVFPSLLEGGGRAISRIKVWESVSGGFA
jgi:hypothetical protein